MNPLPLHHVWNYTDVDRAFWETHLEPWIPARVIDAHTHVVDPSLRLRPMTERMRHQYWVNEVFEPISFATADHCYATVFPKRHVQCLAFGMPDLDFDLDRSNIDVDRGCQERDWFSLALLRPQWTQADLERALNHPSVIGAKPYYSLLEHTPETRDAHLEASIFQFLPHRLLEVLNDRHAWVTLHVPKAGRLGHPDNLREIAELRRRYPKIILVIAHLGRAYTEAHAREGLPPIAEDPGIYVDTSAVLNPAAHRLALELLGPSRILYGSDNPIMYMRGRRTYRDRQYFNHTSHPFHFNQHRESPEAEARYTLFMYEDLLALRQACEATDQGDPDTAQAIFHDNAQRLIRHALQHRPRPHRLTIL